MNKFADCWENEAVSYMGTSNQEVTTTRMYVHLYVIRC